MRSRLIPSHFSHTARLRFLCLLVLLGSISLILPGRPATTYAAGDTFYLGTGRDGALVVSTTNLVINTYAPVTAPLAPGDTAMLRGTSVGSGVFAAGDLVMILQTTGIVPEPPSGGPSPIDLSSSPVGRWELARVATAAGSTITLSEPLRSSYAANVTQLVRVPEYTSVTINAGRSVAALAWNGSVGGVVAFLVNGTLTNNGTVEARARGFRGGLPADDSSGAMGCTGLDEPAPAGGQKGEGIAATRYGPSATGRGQVANGGGGGVCYLAGGGGGGNGGQGGQGGNSDLSLDGNRAVGGQGGTALGFSLLDRLTLGGGGGAGHASVASGGSGGGIVFIRADALSGSGSISANGQASLSTLQPGSGGGAGGTIYLRVAGAASCGPIQAIGGAGGNAATDTVGPGGGGGGGRILLQRGSGTCTLTASSVLGANPGSQTDAGAPGGTAYGAAPGANGSSTVLTGGFAQLSAPIVVTPANGSVIDGAPTYTGTLPGSRPAGTSVAVVVNGSEVARVDPDSGGNWSYTASGVPSQGTYTIYALAINTSQGTESNRSATSTFTVDTTGPAAPVVSVPGNGSLTASGSLTAQGTAEPNASVRVHVDGVLAGTTAADGSGAWSLAIGPLADGPHTVHATATDAAGNVSPNSATITFTVDTTAPAAPVVSVPANGSLTASGSLTAQGTAEPNASVRVHVDGVLTGTTTADDTGAWSLAVGSLADGSHSVQVWAVDAAGNMSAGSATIIFTVETTPTTSSPRFSVYLPLSRGGMLP
jgi:hypothetical protein